MIPVMVRHVGSLRETTNFFEEFYSTPLSSEQFIFVTYLACYLSVEYPTENTLVICRNLLSRLLLIMPSMEVRVKENYGAWLFLMAK